MMKVRFGTNMLPSINTYIQDHSGTVDECPVCCPDFPTIPVHVPPPKNHYHHCPMCYEVFECGWGCTLEPDQDDPDTYPGKEFGAIIPCFECQKIEHNEQKYNDPDFWAVYNGFKKRK